MVLPMTPKNSGLAETLEKLATYHIVVVSIHIKEPYDD